MKIITTLILITLIGTLLTGCITIPQESVELNNYAIHNIRAIEQAHISHINEMYNLLEEKLERIFFEEYIEPYTAQALDSEFLSLTNAQKSQYMSIVTENIEETRKEIFRPIQQERENTINNIMQAYRDTHSSLNALNGLLRSATEVDSTRQEILKEIGLSEANSFIQQGLDLIDQAREEIKNLNIENLIR